MASKFGLPSFHKITVKAGFTLMELIIAMAILAIVTGSILGTYTNSQKKARDARRKSDLKQLQNALEAFANDHRGLYPGAGSGGTLAACSTTGTNLTGSTCTWGTSIFSITNGAIYMQQMVKDPGTVAYYYQVSVDNTKYQIYACLENRDDSQYNEYTSVTCTGCVSNSHCNYGVSSSNATPSETI